MCDVWSNPANTKEEGLPRRWISGESTKILLKIMLKTRRNILRDPQTTADDPVHLSAYTRRWDDRRKKLLSWTKNELNHTEPMHDGRATPIVWGTRVTRNIEGETHCNGTLLRDYFFRTFDPHIKISASTKLFFHSDLHNNFILNRTAKRNAKCHLENEHHRNIISRQKRTGKTWWRHQMETFSALLALCAGNSPVTGEFPSQRPVTRIFFDLRLNKRLSKQSRRQWFETQSHPLWRHCNGLEL